MIRTWTDEEVRRLIELQSTLGQKWTSIATMISQEFNTNRTKYSCQKKYKRMAEADLSEDSLIKNIVQKHSAQKRSRQTAKENRALIDGIITYDDFMIELKDMIASQKIKPLKIKKFKLNKKPKMTIEPMLSDLHVGLKTKNFDLSVIELELKVYTENIIQQIEQKSKFFCVELIHIPILGDLMQAAIHKPDNAVGAYLTNAQQMTEAVRLIFYHFILPLSQLGIPIFISGLPGNHDREDKKQYVENPGITYLTYTMYSCIDMLIHQSKLKHIKVVIPNDHYYIKEIYGFQYLYTHGYTVKGNSSKAIENELSNRMCQNETIIVGIRLGHYHTDQITSLGRLITNGGFPFNDHFGNLLGYKSRPCQIINFYVENHSDETAYESSYVVNFGNLK